VCGNLDGHNPDPRPPLKKIYIEKARERKRKEKKGKWRGWEYGSISFNGVGEFCGDALIPPRVAK